MINKEEQNRITNEAWTKLYQRLEHDGLLTGNTTKRSVRKIYLATKWAAAIVILCICTALTFVLIRPSATPLLSLYNGKGEPTLATTLEDGSIVFLGEHSLLSYPNYFEKNKREVSLKGQAFFDISRNEEKPFSIDTELAKVEVLGTSFNIECNDNSSFILSVKTGEVKTTLKKNNQTVHVKAGESVFLDSGNLHKTTQNLDKFEEYRKKIQFKDERLVNVARVINDLSDSIQINVSPNISDRLITITFAGDSPYNLAELICVALDLNLSQESNVVTISSKN